MKSTIDIDDPELLALPETALALEVVDLVALGQPSAFESQLSQLRLCAASRPAAWAGCR